jgi:hypothetical protein
MGYLSSLWLLMPGCAALSAGTALSLGDRVSAGVTLSLGDGVLSGVSTSDEVSASLGVLRAAGVQRVISLPIQAALDMALIESGAVDAIVGGDMPDVNSQVAALGQAHSTTAGCEWWVHVATRVNECAAASKLGARTIFLDPVVAGEDAFEEMGYLALAIVEDLADATCSSLGDLPDALAAALDDSAPQDERTIRDMYSADHAGTEPSANDATADEVTPLHDSPPLIGTGGGLEGAPQGQTKQHKFCMECGVKLPRSAKFCSECGARQHPL